MGKVYGYVRVSSADQHEDRQLNAMDEHGIPANCIYMDKQSGKDFARPRYRALIKKLRPGDQLCITSIDRLGRNYEEIQEQWRILTREKKVDILVFDIEPRPFFDNFQKIYEYKKDRKTTTSKADSRYGMEF